ncbi:MAG TPA: GNAT family N-acetyltransferase [Candidatus Aquilonibacter sp.]|nr:GNAT family N-acetyltransferase [Candidatus Aquilonibacter sp.]
MNAAFAPATLTAEELLFRPATLLDVSAMAQLRSEQWGNAPDWERSLAAYLSGEHHPRHALLPRVAILAEQDGEVIGFIAGHLTRRHRCEGELQWINVSADHRGQGVATGLLHELADWFASHNARRICVDVRPRNLAARAFYTHNGAEPLNDHWMVWNNIANGVSGR